MKKNKNELQVDALKDLFASTTDDSSQNMKEEPTKEVKENVIRVSRYFKIDKDLATFFDLFCKIYDLNKTSDGIDFVLRKFKELMKEEIKEKLKEQSEKTMDSLFN